MYAFDRYGNYLGRADVDESGKITDIHGDGGMIVDYDGIEVYPHRIDLNRCVEERLDTGNPVLDSLLRVFRK